MLFSTGDVAQQVVLPYPHPTNLNARLVWLSCSQIQAKSDGNELLILKMAQAKMMRRMKLESGMQRRQRNRCRVRAVETCSDTGTGEGVGDEGDGEG